MDLDYVNGNNHKYFDISALGSSFKDKKRMIFIVLLLFVFTVMGFIYQTLIRPCQMSAASGCVLTSGCTSNSCINNKQFIYDSSGKKKCCVC